MSSECLLISEAAREYARVIPSISGDRISMTICTSSDEALDRYSEQTILFGDPDMIATVLPSLGKIDWVQSTWAGVKPLLAIDRRDYVLTGVKDVFGPQITEYVFGYLLAQELKFSQRMSAQRERKWLDVPSGNLHGKRMGIMGTGSIGRHIAASARAFGIQVSGLSLSGSPVAEFNKVLPVTQLHDFLQGIDYLVSTLPDTDATHNLLDAAAIAVLPRQAFFVNVGRGSVVEDEALISALCSGALAGAALDVFDVEPLPVDSPMWETPNLSLTAHIAAKSHPELIAPVFVENYRRYCNKQALNFVVDFDKGY